MICPLCERPVEQSAYLARVFAGDAYAEWLANLVTHYRHGHLASYDRAWQSRAYAARIPGYRAMGHEAFKAAVNNRAKRQLMRGIVKADLSRADKVGLIAACARLRDNEPATLKVMTGLLAHLGAAEERREQPLDGERPPWGGPKSPTGERVGQ